MKKLLLTTLILSMMTLTTHAEELTEEKIKRRDAILKAEAQRKAEQAKKQEQARKAEAQRKAQEAKKAEQARKAEAQRKAEQKAFIFYHVSDFDNYGWALVQLKKGGKYTYIDTNGRKVLDVSIYDYVEPFSENLSYVCKNNNCGFINRQGELVIPLIYDSYFRGHGIGEFSEGLAIVLKNRKYGFIDKSGKEIIPFIYDRAFSFKDGLAEVRLDMRSGLIDKTGKVSIPLIYKIASNLSKGFVYTETRNFNEEYITNTKNSTVVQLPENTSRIGYFFSDGLLAIQQNNHWGFIDEKGNTVIPAQYENIVAPNFSEGVATIYKDGVRSLINTSGKILFSLPKGLWWDGEYKEGLCLVLQMNNDNSVKNRGFINKTGDIVIDFNDYSDARNFSNGFVAVRKNYKWGFIDKTGRPLVIQF